MTRERSIVVGSGKRVQVWRVRSVFPDEPDPAAEERALCALSRLMLPRLQAMLEERTKEETDATGVQAADGGRGVGIGRRLEL